MLNILWPIFLIISFLYAILTGNVQSINDGILESSKNAIELCITLLGTICLWSGIMKIAQKTTFISKLTTLLQPIVNFLFPEIKHNKEIKEAISMNIIVNILGLGNAATPTGLKAMKIMQENNRQKDTLTNSMAMFIVINTASMQLIPTTVISIRSSLGSNSPTSIIFPVWVATIFAAIAGIAVTKLFIKFEKKYTYKRKEYK